MKSWSTDIFYYNDISMWQDDYDAHYRLNIFRILLLSSGNIFLCTVLYNWALTTIMA